MYTKRYTYILTYTQAITINNNEITLYNTKRDYVKVYLFTIHVFTYNPKQYAILH